MWKTKYVNEMNTAAEIKYPRWNPSLINANTAPTAAATSKKMTNRRKISFTIFAVLDGYFSPAIISQSAARQAEPGAVVIASQLTHRQPVTAPL
jgi:hypothetical protein